ncbi:plasmid transfer protein TraA [Streptomyces cupreus]|uniref:Uncharacterized protein n=1 Tax=Streptomyces cupreus TaxID=2759956 RepID=A0A7X1J2T9_9ACTN|nr:plasmid transfer protein TraA [Streptomyces cupreus]MBC2903165.1 hypothetical protein [Streptomyces cupreus]
MATNAARNLHTVPTSGTRKTSSTKARQQARQRKTANSTTKNRTTNKQRNIHIHVHKTGNQSGAGGGAAGNWSRSSPIGDAEFLSAGHVRAFAERGRKAMRQAAMDFSYAHEALRAVLREVPPPQGEHRGQMYMKANRVARSLKRAANAAQAASAHSARTWPAYLREYEPWINAMGGPKPQTPQRHNFGA